MTTDYSAPITAKSPPINANGWLAFGIALLVLSVDQLSKAWILYGLHLGLGDSIRILPILSLTGVENIGVTFGLLRADTALGRVLLSLFAVGVTVALGLWARKAERRLTAIALGMIMGGALGNNLIDRVRLGHVTDFIDVTGLGFFPWVFNIADACIDIGIALLLFETFRPQAKPAAPQA